MVDSVKPPGVAFPGVTSPGATSLEDQLLDAALRQLDAVPAESLSLRKIAQEVGVSHQGPYVHFGSRARFLAALAGAGMERATETARAQVAAAGAEPFARLWALALAYLEFAQTAPHLHDLTTGPLVGKADHPRYQAAAIGYWDLLHDTVAACQPVGTSEAEVLCRCVAAWGTVYGISGLFAHGQVPAAVPEDALGLLRRALQTLYAGWNA